MKTFWCFRIERSTVLVLVIGMALINVDATIITLDFSGIPDGTLASANNPYAGVVNLQGQQVVTYWGPDYAIDVPSETEIGTTLAGGVMVSADWPGNHPPSPPPGIDPPPIFHSVSVNLTATFLEPVRALSFKTQTDPWFTIYDYQGVDLNGDPFSGNGWTPQARFDNQEPGFPFGTASVYTTILEAPDSGYFTQLHVWDWDNRPVAFWFGDFLLSDTHFIDTPVQGVPEPSTLPDKAFLLFLLAVAPFVGRKRG